MTTTVQSFNSAVDTAVAIIDTFKLPTSGPEWGLMTNDEREYVDLRNRLINQVIESVGKLRITPEQIERVKTPSILETIEQQSALGKAAKEDCHVLAAWVFDPKDDITAAELAVLIGMIPLRERQTVASVSIMMTFDMHAALPPNVSRHLRAL